MMSITGRAMFRHFADERERGQAVLCFFQILEHLQPSQTAVTKEKMKWRNQLLALVCLLAFLGVGVIYFQHWVIRKPFGIILFVGEGLSPARLAPTRTYAAGTVSRLTIDSMPLAELLMIYSKVFSATNQTATANTSTNVKR